MGFLSFCPMPALALTLGLLSNGLVRPEWGDRIFRIGIADPIIVMISSW
jgi:hypothetical protein